MHPLTELITHTALASAIGFTDGALSNIGTVRIDDLGVAGHVRTVITEDVPHITLPIVTANTLAGINPSASMNVLLGLQANPEASAAINLTIGAISALIFAWRHRQQGIRGIISSLYGGAYMYAIGSNWGIIPSTASHIAYNIAAERVSRKIEI